MAASLDHRTSLLNADRNFRGLPLKSSMDEKSEKTFWALLDDASTLSRINQEKAARTLADAKAIETEEQTPFRVRAQLEICVDSDTESIRELASHLLKLSHDMPLDARIESLQVILEAGIRVGDRSMVTSSIDELTTLAALPRVPPHNFFHAISALRRQRLIQLFLALHGGCDDEGEFCACQNVGGVLRDYWGFITCGRKVKASKQEAVLLFPEMWAGVTDHLDALADQLEPLGATCIRLARHAETISLRLNNHIEVFTDQNHLADALADIRIDYSLFCQPYMTQPSNQLERIISKLPRIQFSYGPFLAGEDYFSLIGPNSEFLFNGYLQADLIAAQNSWTREHFLTSGVHSDRVATIGDPLMWSLVNNPPQITTPTYDLLWAPHFSVHGALSNCKGYGNGEKDLASILEIADEGLKILIRAHPLMLASMNSNRQSSGLQAVINASLNHPNIVFSTSDIATDLLSSKQCITDGVSIIVYGSLLGRPVYIRRRPDSAGFRPEWQPLIERIPQISGIDLGYLHEFDDVTLTKIGDVAEFIGGVGPDKISPGEGLVTALRQRN